MRMQRLIWIGGMVLLGGVLAGAGLSEGPPSERVAKEAPRPQAAASPDVWPMSGHDPARTSRSAEALPPPLRQVWQVPLPAEPTPHLWVGRKGLILTVEGKHSPVTGKLIRPALVLAFDLQGRERWRYAWPEAEASLVDGGLSETAGVVVVQGRSGVRGLRLADGKELWGRPLAPLAGGLCLAEPMVYVADQTPNGEALALALDVASGEVRHQSEPVAVPGIHGTLWVEPPVTDGQRVIFLFGGKRGVGVSWSPDLAQRHWVHERGNPDPRSDRQALVDGVWWWGEGGQIWRLQAENPERGLVGHYWPGTVLLAFAEEVVIGNHHWHWVSAWDREHLKPIRWSRRVAVGGRVYPLVAGEQVWLPAQRDGYYRGDQGGVRAYTVDAGRLVYATNDGSTKAVAVAGGHLYRSWVKGLGSEGIHFWLTAYTSDPQGPPFRNLSLEWAGSKTVLVDRDQPLAVELWNTGSVPERDLTVVANASVVPFLEMGPVSASYRYRQRVARLGPSERRILRFPKPQVDRQPQAKGVPSHRVWWTVYTAPDDQPYRGDDLLAAYGYWARPRIPRER